MGVFVREGQTVEVFTPEELEEFRKEMSETRRQCREAHPCCGRSVWVIRKESGVVLMKKVDKDNR